MVKKIKVEYKQHYNSNYVCWEHRKNHIDALKKNEGRNKRDNEEKKAKKKRKHRKKKKKKFIVVNGNKN